MSELSAPSSQNTWNHRWTFMLAAAGSAIGLGNIWKFPYIAGLYGGGAFVFVYLVCIFLIGIPLLIAETAIGRRARLSPINAMRKLSQDIGASRLWVWVGGLGMVTGFIILTFYSVVAGWSLAYAWDLLTGTFTGMTSEQVSGEFDALSQSVPRQIFWHTLFMFLTFCIAARGIHKGLENSLQVMMPILFLLLLIMLAYSMVATGEFMRGFHFMFDVDWSKLTGGAVVAAMGQAFFTLSLGMCALMAYGAYMPRKNSIPRTALNVAVLDTAMAVISGLIVFPIVYAYGLEPSAGPSLLFISLTSAFANMGFGEILGFLFFALVGIAALSSAISLVEPSLAWITERFGANRQMAALLICLAVWTVGLGSVFSFNIWSDVTLFGKNFFDLSDFITSSLLLPLGGALIAIFAGWKLSRPVMMKELGLGMGLFATWQVLIRFVVPASILVILYASLF